MRRTYAGIIFRHGTGVPSAQIRENIVSNKLQPNNHSRQTHGLDFFRGFLREPDVVGSVIPSSRYLEKRIITAASLADAGLVLELGPGTGGTTRTLLRNMPADSMLVTVEISKAFTEVLNRIDDARLINHCGSALEIASILHHHDLPSPDIIISGIPFSTIPPDVGRQILENIWHSLKPDGIFIAYQFRSHVAKLAKPVFGDPDITQELRNIPPMRIFRWQKPANGQDPPQR